MNFIKNNLANALTLANLFAGCIGAIHLISGDYQTTAICLILSAVFDFFDGFVARALRSNSNLGLQLDSLADMVSFGLIPGLTMYKALEPFGAELMGLHLPFEVKYLGLIATSFSCLRLAIFNLDEEQRYYFKGLNTPTNTVLLFGLYYAFKETGSFSFLFESEILLLLLTLITSFMLISPVKMIAMKFKSKALKDNYPKIALLLGGIAILAIFKLVGIPLLVIYYILISLVFQKQLK
ncbi:CDP-alcohol phosphatidyltransferase family protein [Chryseobacterium indologenes]|uniref:CDP-alcohol phosphatidyltransferase n=1 Tax=Chryseobacterium indologenes TaxID=253 RepID=A0A1Z3W434_CHRID|nr:CDP-alcohol phosphatidyltransferase family protein [Chryseobacterium indologenes]ASE62523.1 CDP-alcohol phosphatidyltransferase [Chryseobacterium indologenes]ATN06355.1 CDP-alcohol phosphatidyltransferase [Chryseobacterium indologenes]AYY84884.1 CDP-alcohol phosphatidyltransferase [Chryseobacterium indologenes]AYZ34553.1 CDP-alcohol phosphatidyltransferase [Chryseobacterium indologenes]AZB18234.1 CDP-alcohol phosphatidyltransferase [Chryseobacterium indologenes]